MAKLKLKGKVTYPPGPWGTNKPVKGAKITITDIDAPGRTDDVIWEGATDDKGVFQGTSKEWQDRIKLTPAIPATPISPAVPATYGPDPSDVLVLKINVVQGQSKITAPFPFAGDNVQVPVFVTWGPPSNSRGTVNGVEFTDFNQLIDKLIATVEKKDPIDLRLYGDWATAVLPIVQLIKKSPLERVRQTFPSSKTGSIVIPGVITISSTALAALAGLVLALGSLILLAGASTFLVCLGIAVILAVVNGYVNIEASQTTTTDSQGNPTNETRIVLSA
jgi:hypothetical protein